VPLRGLDNVKGLKTPGIHPAQPVPARAGADLDDGTASPKPWRSALLRGDKPEPALSARGEAAGADRDVEPAHGAGAAGLRRSGLSAPTPGRGQLEVPQCPLGARPTSPRRRRSCASSTRSSGSGASLPGTSIGGRHHGHWWRRLYQTREGGGAHKASTTSRAGHQESRPGPSAKA